MAQPPGKVLLEKLETLQNLMIASVTGGERDNEKYRELRNELLQYPAVTQALPRFVRTCGDLSQFWSFIKSDPDLSTYASRRELIWSDFRPLLSSIGDDTNIEHEAFFPKGSDHDAYVHIRSILQTAKMDILIIDGYMDSSIYQVLGTVTAGSMRMKVLTSRIPVDFALEGQKFVKQHIGFNLELRRTKDFHDRFILLDQEKCYLLGASIKDAGNRGFAVVPLVEPSIVQFILNYANEVWASATSL